MSTIPTYIANQQAYDAIIDIIKLWQNKKVWVYQQENPFLEKLAYIYPNPIVKGEVFIEFEVRDRTTFVDGKLDIYSHTVSFQTAALSDPSLNSNGDVVRLRAFLNALDHATKTEREQMLSDFAANGKKIETTNPHLWNI